MQKEKRKPYTVFWAYSLISVEIIQGTDLKKFIKLHSQYNSPPLHTCPVVVNIHTWIHTHVKSTMGWECNLAVDCVFGVFQALYSVLTNKRKKIKRKMGNR